MQRPAGKTLAQVLAEKAAAAPASPALFYADRVWSYRDLLEATEVAAKALLALEIRAGDRIGVLLGNDPDWLVLAMAASRVGATFVPLNTWYKKAEIAWTVRHCGLKLLVS